MSDDLNEFLRRAAQRRKANTAQRSTSDQQQDRRPSKNVDRAARTGQPQRTKEYSDTRRERTIAPESIDEVITAEVVSETAAERRRRIRQAAQRAAAKPSSKASKQTTVKTSTSAAKRSTEPSDHSPRGEALSTDSDVVRRQSSVVDLLAMLRRPGGISQAVLLREILDRPTHRW